MESKRPTSVSIGGGGPTISSSGPCPTPNNIYIDKSAPGIQPGQKYHFTLCFTMSGPCNTGSIYPIEVKIGTKTQLVGNDDWTDGTSTNYPNYVDIYDNTSDYTDHVNNLGTNYRIPVKDEHPITGAGTHCIDICLPIDAPNTNLGELFYKMGITFGAGTQSPCTSFDMSHFATDCNFHVVDVNGPSFDLNTYNTSNNNSNPILIDPCD
ncbi:MAG: hypothetical protein NTX03_00580 [Bacteroidetes bacterium]|nr:hypothetical protein [Bacteroidota bacterium]